MNGSLISPLLLLAAFVICVLALMGRAPLGVAVLLVILERAIALVGRV